MNQYENKKYFINRNFSCELSKYFSSKRNFPG